MASKLSKQREKFNLQFQQNEKNKILTEEQARQSKLALEKLLFELSHIRSCRSLALQGEHHVGFSATLGRRVLCGVCYYTETISRKKLKIEILHLIKDLFRIIVQTDQQTSKHPYREVSLDCRVKFKNLSRLLIFLIPILKDE